MTTEAALEATSEPIPVVEAVGGGVGVGDGQQSSHVVPPRQGQDHDRSLEVPKPGPIPIPLPSIMEDADASPPVSSKVSTPSTPAPVAITLPVTEKIEESASEPIEKLVPPAT